MEKLPVIAQESLEAVMDEVSNEIDKIMAKTPSKEERVAFLVFYYSMTKTALDFTKGMGLSDEEQEDFLTVCGIWWDIGMLAGRSNKLLVDILARASSKIARFTPPEWFHEKARAIVAAEEIARGHDTD